MKKIELATYPTQLPNNVEVRDYDMEDGTYFRVIMEVDPNTKLDHLHMTAQAFEMNADGSFKQAPNGYPSRTRSSTHTVLADSLNDTIFMDDAWVRHVVAAGSTLDPVALNLPTVTARPTEPGTEYGQLVWDSSAMHAWRWQEGYADGVARAKLQDIQRIMRASNVLSGFGFR